jgi:hypothetical protein
MRRREFIAGLGAAGWPLLVRAQQQTKPIIGSLLYRPGGWPLEAVEAFRWGLAEADFSEGRDVTVEYYLADGHPGRLPALVADVVRRRPAVDHRSYKHCGIGHQSGDAGYTDHFYSGP